MWPHPAVVAILILEVGRAVGFNPESSQSGSTGGIGCFTCQSFNGSDQGCADPFSPAFSSYKAACKQGVGGRVGLFPAHYCVKMSGKSEVTGAELVVRTCTLETMHHQCGVFEFEKEKFRGCLTSCDRNGCNHGNPTVAGPPRVFSFFLCALCLALFKVHWWI